MKCFHSKKQEKSIKVYLRVKEKEYIYILLLIGEKLSASTVTALLCLSKISTPMERFLLLFSSLYDGMLMSLTCFYEGTLCFLPTFWQMVKYEKQSKFSISSSNCCHSQNIILLFFFVFLAQCNFFNIS